MSAVILIALSLVLNGCGGNITQLYKDNNRKAGYELIQIPKLNTENTVEIGENIYQKINKFLNITNTVTLNNSSTGKWNIAWQFFDCKFHAKDSALLELWENNKYTTELGVCYSKIGTTHINEHINLIDNNKTGYFTHFSVYYSKDISPLSEKIKYTISPTVKFKEDSFKYEALYQGKNGNKIKISYREFKDNMARPAFTQDIEYELEKDGTTMIGFKGLRIEILKATNMDITYKVIKDYN